jgi:betaine-aldehyde dehydrogenase
MSETVQTREHLYIGGEWVAPSGTGTIDVISPYTEQVIGTAGSTVT